MEKASKGRWIVYIIPTAEKHTAVAISNIYDNGFFVFITDNGRTLSTHISQVIIEDISDKGESNG